MIAYFPKAYDDELCYSVLARAYIANGFMVYRDFAEEILEHKQDAPSLLYINKVGTDTMDRLLMSYGCDTVGGLIDKSTLYPYYSRFYDGDRRKEAKEALVCGQQINDLIRRKPKGGMPFLRFCVECAKEDRERYGETYWHRIHQMDGIRCCPKHGILLNDSVVIYSGKASPSFTAAECVLPAGDTAGHVSDMEAELARFHQKILYLPTDENASPIDAIKDQLRQCGYMSVRGGMVHIKELERDMAAFYQDIPQERLLDWQIQKLLAGKRTHPKDICSLSYFLKLQPEQLIAAGDFDTGRNIADFDRKCRKLLEEGIGVNEAARMLGLSSRTVRDIRDHKLTAQRKIQRGTGGSNKKDWQALDDEALSKVLAYIDQVKEAEAAGGRPRKITYFGAAKVLGMGTRTLTRLEKCVLALKPYQETQEEFWAREIGWCIHKLEAEGQEINYTALRRALNLRRGYIITALPYMKDQRIREIALNMTEAGA